MVYDKLIDDVGPFNRRIVYWKVESSELSTEKRENNKGTTRDTSLNM